MYYKLKDAVRRGILLLGATGLLVGIGASAMPAFASADDTLNPLTDRSLTLSSSAPGYVSTDGSGNVTYASPNSGANGSQTGNTFSFVQSTTSTVNALSFQYCTLAAGNCYGPGNNSYVTSGATGAYADYPACAALPANGGPVGGTGTDNCERAPNGASNSDLNVATGTGGGLPTEISQTTYNAMTSNTADSRGNTCFTKTGTTWPADAVANCAYTGSPATSGTDYFPGLPQMDNSEGNFGVFQVTGGGSTHTLLTGWVMQTENLEDATVGDGTGSTGTQNMIVLENTNGTGTEPTFSAGESLEVVFYGNADNYIMNPGAGAFFVKINDYLDPNLDVATPNPVCLPGSNVAYCVTNPDSGGDPTDFGPNATDIVDGGVTVANVMNQSIEIQTKVLETMDFSVGTVDPDTLSLTQLNTAEGNTNGWSPCVPILNQFVPGDASNTLLLGNEQAEDSLMTTRSFATHSYFRLSSNSSGGATVYYAGVPLSNTEGNQIDAGGETAATSSPGEEQFGLGLDIASSPYGVGTSGNEQPDYSVANSDSATSPGTGIKFENGADTDNGVDTPGVGGTSPTSGSYGLSTGSNSFTAYQTTLPAAVHDPMLYPLEPTTGYGSASGGINAVSTADGNNTAEFSFNPNSNTIPTPIASESSQVVNCVTGKVRYMSNIAATTAAGIYTTKVNYIAAPQY